MKSIFEKVIQRGSYDLNGLLKRIDEYHVEGKLTDEERAHLIAAARGDARPQLELAAEVQQLWAAVGELRAELAAIKAGGGVQDGVDELDIPEYTEPTGAHDAYYAGAVVRWQGQVYECVAPEGVACVWSPEVMPGYWAEVTITEEDVTEPDEEVTGDA